MIDVTPELLTIIMLGGIFVGVIPGFPLAIPIGGVAVILGFLLYGTHSFDLIFSRVYGLVTNYTLLAVPCFIFMGGYQDLRNRSQQIRVDIRPGDYHLAGQRFCAGQNDQFIGDLRRECLVEMVVIRGASSDQSAQNPLECVLIIITENKAHVSFGDGIVIGIFSHQGQTAIKQVKRRQQVAGG